MNIQRTRIPGLRGITMLLLTTAMLLAPRAYAGETPRELAGATIVAADRVKQLLDRGVPIVDTRVGNEFAESHIRGAINIPYKEHSLKAPNFNAAQDNFDLAKLPQDKDKPIVFYCNSGECWKSYKASTVALRAGYRQVFWFRGGYPEWKKMGLPVE